MKCMNRVYYKSGAAHNHGDETEDLARIAAVNECVKLAAERDGSLKRIMEVREW